MKRIRPLLLGLFVLAGVGLAGCADSTSPSGLDIDAIEVANQLNALLIPLQASSEVTTTMDQAFTALTDAGVVLTPVTVAVQGALRAAGPATLGSGPVRVEFPPELQGSTFVYDPDPMEWVVDETREGAPADGVRVIWYAVEGTSTFFRLPLEELGYVDLTSEPATDGTDWLRLEAIRYELDGASDVEVLDFNQWHEQGIADGTTTERFVVDGVFADAQTVVDVRIESDASADGSTDSELNTLDVAMETQEASYTFSSTETVDGGTGVVTNDLASTFVRDGVTLALDLTLDTELNSTALDGTGSLTRNGALIADLAIVSGELRFTHEDGETLSSADTAEIDFLVSAMIFNVPLFPIFQLPLYFN